MGEQRDEPLGAAPLTNRPTETFSEERQREVVMNQYRLRIEFDKFQRDRDRKKFDDSWPWIGAFLAFLLALLPADFQEFGLSAAVWEAVAVILTVGSGFMVLRIWYQAYRQRKDKAPSPQEAVESLIEEMGSGRGRFTQSESDREERLNQEAS